MPDNPHLPNRKKEMSKPYALCGAVITDDYLTRARLPKDERTCALCDQMHAGVAP